MSKNFLHCHTVVVTEKEFGLRHDVLQGSPSEWCTAQGATHTLLCDAEKRAGGWGKRGAKLTKTRLYVLTDEDENGKGVWQKWEVSHYAGFCR